MTYSKYYHWWLVFFFLPFMNGCTLSYYSHVITGHFSILSKKQDIEFLIQDPNTDPELVRKLKLNQDVRAFAMEEMGLPKSKVYTEYADLGRSYVSLLVTASDPLKLDAYEWWYPFIGFAEYRGYFDPEKAKALAAEMKTEGWDVALRKARAYSTLALNSSWVPDYFKDPVLNTFLDRSDLTIISTLIHEISHQVVYISGDTAFNESFASFVEREGLRQYLKQRYDNPEELFERYLQQEEDQRRFRGILAKAYQQLQELYESELSNFEKLEEKEKIFAAMKTSYQQQSEQFLALDYSRWFDRPLNNAHLLGVRQYANYVDAFAKLFERSGRQWPRFYKEVKKLSKLPKQERDQQLCSEASC